MSKTLSEKLRNLQLSADEVKRNNPAWSDEMVLDYLSKNDDLQTLAKELSAAADSVIYQQPQFSIEDFSQALGMALFPAQKESENDIIFLRDKEAQEVRVYSGTETLARNSNAIVNIGGTVGSNSVLTINVRLGFYAQYSSAQGYYVASNVGVGGQIINNTQIQLFASNIAFGLDAGVSTSEEEDAVVYWTVVDYGD